MTNNDTFENVFYQCEIKSISSNKYPKRKFQCGFITIGYLLVLSTYVSQQQYYDRN